MKHLVLVLAVLIGTPFAPVQSAEGNAAFSLKIRGLTMGVIYLTERADDRRYAVSGVIESTGLAAAIRRFSYRGSATGRVSDGQLHPERYQESADTGRRSSTALITYQGGVPTIVEYTSPKEPGPDAPDPSTQVGTIDPLSAIYALLRDVPRARACQLDAFIFDGKRRSRIAMHPAEEKDGLPTCAGRYERLQGFTAKEVSRHRYFDFTVTYGDAGNGLLKVEDVSFDSFYGTASIDRR